MICVIALIVFAILAIFSARYRPLAKEAFDCTFRKITFRKCRTNLDQRIRAKLTGKLMRVPKVARFTYNHFQFLSFAFTILFILSIAFTGIGAYNYAVYGNCNGPHNDDFCIFNPLSNGVSCGSEHCADNGCTCGEGEENCTVENNFAPCEGDCDCDKEVCG